MRSTIGVTMTTSAMTDPAVRLAHVVVAAHRRFPQRRV
jgi:hypothetical protein